MKSESPKSSKAASILSPITFRSAREFRSFLRKASKSPAETSRSVSKGPPRSGVWVEFYKAGYGENGMSQKQAVDVALCFGWTYGILKSLGYDRYTIFFTPRKKKSAWSASMVKRFKQLQKEGLVDTTGFDAFRNRGKSIFETERPEFSKAQLALFKKNKKAWAFFESQTESYRKYMIQWVLGAKLAATQAKRLQELIDDSADGTKLKRIVEATERHNERQKTKYPDNQTPIEVAKNIGPKIGAEMRALGIETLEQLKREGWENVALRWIEVIPERAHLMAIKALAGAAEEQSLRNLDPEHVAAARALLNDLKLGRF